MLKTILVTGGAGFIGSNFIEYFIGKYKQYKLINLDKLTYAGNHDNLSDLSEHPSYEFIQGDICDKKLINDIFSNNDIRGIIHFAAESHVDNSIEGPEAFIHTNIYGTFVLLDMAKRYWMIEPFKYKKNYNSCRFHHISTDEVYGSLGSKGFFTEATPYAPNSPYSASKASSDMIVRSYFHTYGLNIVTTNCSNNYGPKQNNEKFIPTIIRKALNNDSIPVYGDGKNIRDWLYVTDHCKGIDLVFHHGKAGRTYNIGGNNERENIYIAQKICDILDKKIPLDNGRSYLSLIKYVKDRPGHDRRYAIDATRIKNELGWKAKENFETGIEKTINWYLEKWLVK